MMKNVSREILSLPTLKGFAAVLVVLIIEASQSRQHDLKELAEYKESLDHSSNEIASSNSNQEKEGPPQDSDIRHLIREECCTEVSEEQKQNMENTILDALNSKLLSINSQRLDNKEQEVKKVVEQPTECRTRIEQSLQNFRVIHKSSTSLKNTSQISPVHAITPMLSTKEPEYSPSMGYEHPNTTLETESDEIIKSGVEELVPILSENKVTLEDKRECDVPVCENSPVCDDHSDILSDSNNDDDISSDERHRVHNFLPEFETFCDHTEETRSGNTTTHANDSLLKYDSFCFEIEPDQERGHPFFEALLIDDSIPFPVNEPSEPESDFDNPSFPRPPPEPPDFDFEFDFERDLGDEILVVMNTIVEFECLDLRDEFDVSNDENNDYSSFMFVIYSKVSSFLLSAESEDTIFDPVEIVFPPDFDFEFDFERDLGDEISVVMNTIVKFECLDLRDEFDVSNDENDDYSSFMFVIYSQVFSFLLSAEGEDTTFDPGISV
uniref:Uncharacterized protein n=1 Tax=Tanacetum cinerariifolium TaxID=118510 RepID=A0A6L2MMM8_TANCI|nr:hypothetical protein [Tanacetum cinerariifolium]